MALTEFLRYGSSFLAGLRARCFLFIPLVLVCCIITACQSSSGVRSEFALTVADMEGVGPLEFDGWIRTVVFFKQGRALVIGGCQANSSPEPSWTWDSFKFSYMLWFYETRSPRGTGRDTSCSRGLVQVRDILGNASEGTYVLPQTVTALTVSPDGTRWVAGDAEGRLISSTAVTRVSTRTPHQKSEITTLAFSPDGKWVASGAYDASFPLGFLDIASGGMVKVKMKFDPISALAFSSNGKELAVGTVNGGVAVWAFPSNAIPVQIAPGGSRKQEIMGLTVSPDSRLLAYGRRDGKVAIVDLGTRRALFEYEANSAITALAFSPDGQYLAMGQESGKVLLLDTAGARIAWSKRFLLPIMDLAYSPDGRSLAVAVPKAIHLFHIETGNPNPTPLQRTAGQSTRGNFGSGGRLTRSMVSRTLGPVPLSRNLAEIVRISQDEYIWLLPFDKLALRAVEAMAAFLPGAGVEHQRFGRLDQVTIKVGEQSLALDLARLQQAEGAVGRQQMMQVIESAQRFLLIFSPEAARSLEDAAISAVLSELGPGLHLISGQEPGVTLSTLDWPTGAHAMSTSVSGVEGIRRMFGSEGVRYLKIAAFDRDAVRHVRQWLANERGPRPQAVAHVLDLRDNTGGDLDSLIGIASSLLPKGQVITKAISRKSGEEAQYKSYGPGMPAHHLVVLVNEHTAGTAELLACAIRKAGIGFLVGSRTAGIDEIYTTFPLPSGSQLRVSTGWLSCLGEGSIRWKGEAVDVEADRVSPSVAVAVQSAGYHPLFQTNQMGSLPNVLSLKGDSQLKVGVELALCLTRAQYDEWSGQQVKDHVSRSGQTGCIRSRP